ncbi:1-deoxy-D-xylulose-5-phosphate reductoisomerase, partial [Pseudomonas aeruginosa]|nr:1-deoxy-D-xylulose-5-phosphate reductoisomerase [Pseudomonas aeruginosa]
MIPTYYGLKAGNDIAFANKETLVAGGELIMNTAAETGQKLLPVDSEHSAIFQCLQGNPQKALRRILLTASGGPFRGFTLKQLAQVTL